MAKRGLFRGNSDKGEVTEAELLSKAENYCARAEHCADEVKTKVLQWGGDSSIAEHIIERLYENHFLDDARYCHAYTHDKLLYQHWGKVKIRMMLNSKHLPEEQIRAAIDEIDEAEYARILRDTAAQKKNAEREALIRFLLQRGFEYQEICKAIIMHNA